MADRIGAFNTLTPAAAVIGGLVSVMFAAANSNGAVIVFAIFYGAFSGAFISLLPPMLASMSRSPAEMGLRIGFGYCLSSLAMLTSTPIDGALLRTTNQWARATVFSGVVILTGTACLATARTMHSRRKGTWKA